MIDGRRRRRSKMMRRRRMIRRRRMMRCRRKGGGRGEGELKEGCRRKRRRYDVMHRSQI